MTTEGDYEIFVRLGTHELLLMTGIGLATANAHARLVAWSKRLVVHVRSTTTGEIAAVCAPKS
ncbi:MAG: hypothetical protein ACHREM_11120 [Polyangiales bacterium]